VFSPVPRSYKHSYPEGPARGAPARALATPAEGAITVSRRLKLGEFKTKRVAGSSPRSGSPASVLFVIAEATEAQVWRATARVGVIRAEAQRVRPAPAREARAHES
jgi:hypothetical protein